MIKMVLDPLVPYNNNISVSFLMYFAIEDETNVSNYLK